MDERHRQLSEALRLTVEYVGLKTLHPVEGWSWFDALQTEPWFDDWLESMTAPTFDNQETAVMDERRDLVDREELRRRLEADGWNDIHSVMHHLDAMPAVECPRGWTRDEVPKDLDADPDAACDNDLLYEAWGLIANSSGGNWEEADRLAPGWKAAAERWRDAWHRTLPGRVAPEPKWVPLTQLVGRTIDGCSGAVNRFHVDRYHAKWWALHDLEFQDRPFPEGTLNLETGQVAVRPKAAT